MDSRPGLRYRDARARRVRALSLSLSLELVLTSRDTRQRPLRYKIPNTELYPKITVTTRRDGPQRELAELGLTRRPTRDRIARERERESERKIQSK